MYKEYHNVYIFLNFKYIDNILLRYSFKHIHASYLKDILKIKNNILFLVKQNMV